MITELVPRWVGLHSNPEGKGSKPEPIFFLSVATAKIRGLGLRSSGESGDSFDKVPGGGPEPPVDANTARWVVSAGLRQCVYARRRGVSIVHMGVVKD